MPEDRARSFIERYVIARAVHFRAGQETEDAWQCAIAAKSVYRNIANVARDAEPPEFASGGMVGNATQAPPNTQAQRRTTGLVSPLGRHYPPAQPPAQHGGPTPPIVITLQGGEATPPAAPTLFQRIDKMLFTPKGYPDGTP